MNRRAFLARVFTVAAATSTFALGPSPTSANRLEPVRIADTKAIASSADVMPTTTESTTIASSVGVAQAYTSKMDRAGTSRQAR